MKNMLLLLLVLFPLWGLGGCNKNDDDPKNPIDQLPPATQTGEQTFGCLLDGEAFLPGPGANPLDAVYQFVDGGYYFALQANKRDSNNNLIGLSLGTLDLEILQDEVYQLSEYIDGNSVGGYFSNLIWSYTDLINQGELTITKLDPENFIVSGTFWYDIEDSNGVIHQIREGRFDMHYTN